MVYCCLTYFRKKYLSIRIDRHFEATSATGSSTAPYIMATLDCQFLSARYPLEKSRSEPKKRALQSCLTCKGFAVGLSAAWRKYEPSEAGWQGGADGVL